MILKVECSRVHSQRKDSGNEIQQYLTSYQITSVMHYNVMSTYHANYWFIWDFIPLVGWLINSLK